MRWLARNCTLPIMPWTPTALTCLASTNSLSPHRRSTYRRRSRGPSWPGSCRHVAKTARPTPTGRRRRQRARRRRGTCLAARRPWRPSGHLLRRSSTCAPVTFGQVSVDGPRGGPRRPVRRSDRGGRTSVGPGGPVGRSGHNGGGGWVHPSRPGGGAGGAPVRRADLETAGPARWRRDSPEDRDAAHHLDATVGEPPAQFVPQAVEVIAEVVEHAHGVERPHGEA